MHYQRLLAGFSFDANGPYLVLDDFKNSAREFLYLSQFMGTISRLKERFCVGRCDLVSLQWDQCPQGARLTPKTRGNTCRACALSTGFNPAFYNTSSISSQQSAYNRMPHIVYLAYFAPGRIKVGIAQKRRQLKRLLEQGARAAFILQEFPDAYQARELNEEIGRASCRERV